MEAAETFTKALDLIESSKAGKASNGTSSSLVRQIVTLTNNRSAMYEKGELKALFSAHHMHPHIVSKTDLYMQP